MNLTQTQLVEQLGIAQQTITHYEGGKLRISADFLPDIAEILNFSLDELKSEASNSEKKARLQQLLTNDLRPPKLQEQKCLLKLNEFSKSLS